MGILAYISLKPLELKGFNGYAEVYININQGGKI
jgi:hypothetical protein